MEQFPSDQNTVSALESTENELELAQQEFEAEAARLEENMQALGQEQRAPVLEKLHENFARARSKAAAAFTEVALPGLAVTALASAYPAIHFFLTGEYSGDVFELLTDLTGGQALGETWEAVNESVDGTGKKAWAAAGSLKNFIIGAPVVMLGAKLYAGMRSLQAHRAEAELKEAQ